MKAKEESESVVVPPKMEGEVHMKPKQKKLSVKTCIALKNVGFPQHVTDRKNRKYYVFPDGEEIYRPSIKEVREWFKKRILDTK